MQFVLRFGADSHHKIQYSKTANSSNDQECQSTLPFASLNCYMSAAYFVKFVLQVGDEGHFICLSHL